MRRTGAPSPATQHDENRREAWKSIKSLLSAGLEMQSDAHNKWLAEMETTYGDLVPLLRQMPENDKTNLRVAEVGRARKIMSAK